jgi:endonuclease/exonuclease/phosphatase family metal-dependent hydrolase
MLAIRSLLMAVLSCMLICGGCASGDKDSDRSRPASARNRPEPDRDTIRVMTQNMGYGGGAGLDVFTSAFSSMWKNVERSKPAERMAGIAEYIDRAQPDLVGLQEAVIWRTGGMLSGKADDVKYDFVKLLLADLRKRGLDYRVVARSTNADLEFPARVDGSIKKLRMTDQDVILARESRNVRILEGKGGNYRSTYAFKVPVLGKRYEYKRGWAYVDAEVQGQRVRFVSTHLEVFDEDVQREQARELVDGPARARTPVILVGDINADANRNAASYRLLRDGGLRDAWTEVRREDSGLTCCQADDYRNSRSGLDRRIDVVLYRGPELRPTATDRVGEDAKDKTPSGLWPSDHAAVIADLEPGSGRSNRVASR